MFNWNLKAKDNEVKNRVNSFLGKGPEARELKAGDDACRR